MNRMTTVSDRERPFTTCVAEIVFVVPSRFNRFISIDIHRRVQHLYFFFFFFIHRIEFQEFDVRFNFFPFLFVKKRMFYINVLIKLLFLRIIF